jgi:hypothetical protein
MTWRRTQDWDSGKPARKSAGLGELTVYSGEGREEDEPTEDKRRVKRKG